MGWLFSTEVVFWFWLQGTKLTDRWIQVNLISYCKRKTGMEVKWLGGGGGETHLAACHLDLISSNLSLWRERALGFVSLTFFVVKMLVILSDFPCFLHQSCLRKRTNWGNFFDPKASKIKPEQEKWCKPQARPSASPPSKGVWPSLGLCLRGSRENLGPTSS